MGKDIDSLDYHASSDKIINALKQLDDLKSVDFDKITAYIDDEKITWRTRRDRKGRIIGLLKYLSRNEHCKNLIDVIKSKEHEAIVMDVLTAFFYTSKFTWKLLSNALDSGDRTLLSKMIHKAKRNYQANINPFSLNTNLGLKLVESPMKQDNESVSGDAVSSDSLSYDTLVDTNSSEQQDSDVSDKQLPLI